MLKFECSCFNCKYHDCSRLVENEQVWKDQLTHVWTFSCVWMCSGKTVRLCDFSVSLLASWSITHVMIDNSLKVCRHGVTFSFTAYRYESMWDFVFETVSRLKLLSGTVIKKHSYQALQLDPIIWLLPSHRRLLSHLSPSLQIDYPEPKFLNAKCIAPGYKPSPFSVFSAGFPFLFRSLFSDLAYSDNEIDIKIHCFAL